MDYRVYLLDSSGHIRSASELAAETEEEAEQRAASMAREQPVELWQGAKLLKAFRPGS